MIVSERLGCIFVHVQKTGGTSIEAVMREHDPSIGSNMHNGRRHLSAWEIRDLVGDGRWQRAFKFAFVRNPWDRLVSWYHMCVHAVAPNPFAAFVRAHTHSFNDFLDLAATDMGARTARNQLDYVTNSSDEVIVDFVGRYEALNEDFSRVRERLGIRGELPRLNRSLHKDYRDFYTTRTRELVGERFARDIGFFGYRFQVPPT